MDPVPCRGGGRWCTFHPMGGGFAVSPLPLVPVREIPSSLDPASGIDSGRSPMEPSHAKEGATRSGRPLPGLRVFRPFDSVALRLPVRGVRRHSA